MQFVKYDWAEDLEAARRKSINLARRALQVTRNDAGVIASAAMVLAVFGEDLGTMMALVDDALALNPNSAGGWYHSGFLRRYLAACYAHMGEVEEAQGVVKRLRAITSAVMPPDIMYLRDPEHRQLYLSGLRLASAAPA